MLKKNFQSLLNDHNELFKKLHNYIHVCAINKNIRYQDRDDVVQYTLVRIIRNLERYDSSKGSFLTFIYPMIFGAFKDYYRVNSILSRSHLRDISKGKAQPITIVSFHPKHHEKVSHIREDHFDSMIRCLPSRQKYILTRYFKDNILMGDIAKELGVAESRISQLITKSLKHLEEKGYEFVARDLVKN